MKHIEVIFEENLQICGCTVFDKCIATFFAIAQSLRYLADGDNRFKRAWLNSPQATNFAASSCHSMEIFGKSILITLHVLERMRVFKVLSTMVFVTSAHQTTYLNVTLSLSKNRSFQIPHVLEMFQDLFSISPKEVVDDFEQNRLNPFFLTKFRVY